MMMMMIWCKIFNPALKDYLFLRHFALGTFSTKGAHNIKQFVTQIPGCILIYITLYFLQLYKQCVSYCIV